MNPIFIVAYASTLSPVLPLIISLRKKTVDHQIRLIQLLSVISIVVDLVCLFLSRNRINTHPIGNLFLLIQSLILLVIFLNSLKLNKFIPIMLTTYSICFLINYFAIQGPNEFNSYSHTVSSVMFILLALSYFRLLLIELPDDFVHKIPMVWIAVAILVYYSGNLFLFILNNYFSHSINGNQGTLWILHNVLNISKNLFFFIALWQSLDKISSSSS